MTLEVHDTEEANSLAGQVEVDYAYQAEQWVQDLTTDESRQQGGTFPLARFVLKDDGEVLAVWTYQDGTATLAERSPRFTGEWQANSTFTPR